MSQRPYRVLIVTDDRKLQRRLSQFLRAFGYEVQQAAACEQAQTAMEGERPDFMIVEPEVAGASGLQFCRQVCRQASDTPIYTLLLASHPRAEQLTEALEAGVEDFLEKPAVFGELLSRLREGARVLEFERRMRRQATIDRLSELAARPVVSSHLRREFARTVVSGSQLLSLVLLDVDFLASINHRYGVNAGDEVLRQLTQRLRQLAGEQVFLGSLGGGKYCAVVVGLPENRVLAWADRVRDDLDKSNFEVDSRSVRVTLSGGIATSRTASSPDELFEQANDALELAKLSGRNCAVVHGQFEDESKVWGDRAAAGRLFDTTVAHHIMTPCTLQVGAENPLVHAAALFHQSKLKYLPVCGPDGKLLGLLDEATVLDDCSQRDQRHIRVRQVMRTNVPQCHEDTPFAELATLLSDDCETLVVVHQGKPTGTIDVARLAALSQPLDTASFQSPLPFSLASDYLVVT